MSKRENSFLLGDRRINLIYTGLSHFVRLPFCQTSIDSSNLDAIEWNTLFFAILISSVIHDHFRDKIRLGINAKASRGNS